MTKARDIASAIPAPSTVSSAELGFLDGVTSAIQTQMDAKAPSSTAVTLTGTQTLTNKTLTSPVIASVVNNTLTSTTGDMIYASAANTPARLGIGSTSQVLTVAGGIPSWATPAGGVTFSGTRVRNSGSGILSIPNSTATALTFNTEDYDTDGIHSTSSNTSRFTVPSGKSGYWQISFFFNYDSVSGGVRSIYVYKNGSFNALISSTVPSATGDRTGSNNGTMTYNLAVADYIELYAFQNSGGSLNINTPDQYGNAEFTYQGA